MLLISMLLMAAQVAPASATAAKNPEKVICKTIQEVHSRIPERICLKASEWELREKETQDDLRSSRHRRTSGQNGLIGG
jgi:hypothetical protein